MIDFFDFFFGWLFDDFNMSILGGFSFEVLLDTIFDAIFIESDNFLGDDLFTEGLLISGGIFLEHLFDFVFEFGVDFEFPINHSGCWI